MFGFLSGMFSEGLIGSTQPMADVLADAMIWLGLGISLAAVVCPIVALRLKKQLVLRWMVLMLPFLLLGGQIVLAMVSEEL